jgi:hypothetical protein
VRRTHSLLERPKGCSTVRLDSHHFRHVALPKLHVCVRRHTAGKHQ